MWDNHIFRPVCYTVPNAPQDMGGPLSHEGTQLTPVELPINRDPQIPLCRANTPGHVENRALLSADKGKGTGCECQGLQN